VAELAESIKEEERQDKSTKRDTTKDAGNLMTRAFLSRLGLAWI
jgi:hypothetical protein